MGPVKGQGISVPEVVALCSHFATFSWELNFHEEKKIIINFQKEKGKSGANQRQILLLIILIVKTEKSSNRAT